MLNRKDTSLNSWIDKKSNVNDWIFYRKIKVKLNLSNYATKADLKDAAGAHASKFAKNVDLVDLKSNVDKLDID